MSALRQFFSSGLPSPGALYCDFLLRFAWTSVFVFLIEKSVRWFSLSKLSTSASLGGSTYKDAMSDLYLLIKFSFNTVNGIDTNTFM